MNHTKHRSCGSNISCKKQRTVYLNKFEHEAMERLFRIFSNISDVVSSTQTALELLQESRKAIRDLINNEFDLLISELTNLKMDLLESLSCKYRSKCKKLETQLTFMKLSRNEVSSKKREFEKISVNCGLSESERERNLICLTNAQICKLNESLNGKKVIISSSINMRCISSIKECLHVLSKIKIVSFHNKRYFEELYGDILMPLSHAQNKKKLKKRKKGKNIKRRIINITDDDVTDTTEHDLNHINHIKLRLIDTQSSSSNSDLDSRSNESSSINKEITDDRENERKLKLKSKSIPSYSIPSQSKQNEEEIMYNDELKDMEEDNGNYRLSKMRAKYGELCRFSCNLKSFGIGLTNNNRVAHKNHGNFSEDYVLLDVEHVIRKRAKCYRFHHNTASYALWGIVAKNEESKYDVKHVWGCCTENTFIKNGDYIDNKIKTEQWCGKLVDMMLDLNAQKLKFCSPNFIEPNLMKSKMENEKLNQTIILNGIDKTKSWCPILKLKHKDTFVMVRQIPIQWFGKYPKAVQFHTFTNV